MVHLGTTFRALNSWFLRHSVLAFLLRMDQKSHMGPITLLASLQSTPASSLEVPQL